MTISITAPFDEKTARSLRAGDRVLLSGTVYTARDAAHRRICEALDRGEAPPFGLADAVIYYVGPAPARPGAVIGSAGPTTSYRMDAYAPRLMEHGLRGMIGKGPRSDAVAEAMARYGAVYFAATGGAGALLARCVTASEPVAWPDLGSEAVRRLTLKDLPLTVALDTEGRDLYRLGPAAYLASL